MSAIRSHVRFLRSARATLRRLRLRRAGSSLLSLLLSLSLLCGPGVLRGGPTAPVTAAATILSVAAKGAATPAPSLTLAETHPVTTTGPVSTTILGRLNTGVANTAYTITFYAAADSCPPATAAGTSPIGAVAVTTDVSGTAVFSPTIAVSPDPTGLYIAATATDARNTTSPFSSCVIAHVANDNWIHAQTLDVTSGSVTVDNQYVYTPNQERWYRFLVTPGSQVHVGYTGLPGAVLTLHTDVQQAYNALTTPTNPALEGAKDTPQGFLPQGFLPQGFLPQGFLPQGFLPQGFLPQGFLPQGFLPQGFLPAGALPQGFLPQGFLPQGFLPGAYRGAGWASLLAISANPNSATQTIDHPTWDNYATGLGYFYVRVAGGMSPATPFTLTVSVQGGVCGAVRPVPDAVQNPSLTIPSGLKTVIVWDSSRISGTLAEKDTLRTKLADFAARPEVQGAVIDLGALADDGSPLFPRVVAANKQADMDGTNGTPDNLACPTAKNVVAAEIKRVIGSYRALNQATLQYVVLVGSDHDIPFVRYPDESGLGLENGYVPPVADLSAANASLRNNYVLGQDDYGAALGLPRGDHAMPIPDLAVGRLVETAADVSHMLDAYTAADGVITPHSALVTGYDFVSDAATAATAELSAGLNPPSCSTAVSGCYTPDQLIQPQGKSPTDPSAWTADNLRQKLLGSRHDLVFLTGHFSAGSLLASDYATHLDASEVASSTVDLTNTLVMILGCHSGYNISSADAFPGLSPAPDWPRALALKGATLLASTGYAYGDTVLTEYGEHLFDNYVRQLRTSTGPGNTYVPVPVGLANVAAKKEYLATHVDIGGVDEKTLLETTLYGLPMLRVNMTGQHVGAPSDSSIVSSVQTVPSGPGQALGLGIGQTNGSSDIDVTPALTAHSVQLTNTANNAAVTATYLSGPDGVVDRPLEPILPLQRANVHVDNEILRGVGFRGGTFVDTGHVTPLTGAPATETSVGHPAFFSSVFYPTQVWTANYFDAIDGGPERLVTVPAQYRSTVPGSLDGTLRQFSDLTFRLFYLPSNWTSNPTTSQAAVAAAPDIANVSTISAGITTFRVQVLSDALVGVQQVWVTYLDPNHAGTWTSLDLTRGATDPTLWEATSGLPTGTLFMVQAVNGAGLVSLSTNSGAFYSVGATSSPTTGTATRISVQSPPTTGAYRTTSTYHVHLESGAGNVPTPLGGQTVALQLGGQELFGTTGTSGDATIAVPLDQPPGTYDLSASFAGASTGTTTYLASSSEAHTFTITKAPTILSLAAVFSASSDLVAVTAALTDGAGNGVPQRAILFTVSDATGQVLLEKSVITDYKGHASLGAIPLPGGRNTVSASFGQNPSGTEQIDPYYLPASASIQPASTSIQPASTSIQPASTSIQPASAPVLMTGQGRGIGGTATPELGSSELLFTGLVSVGAVLFYRRARRRAGLRKERRR